MSDRVKGTLLILGAALLWGTTGTAQAVGPSGTSPLAVGTLRLVLGGAGLVAVAAFTGKLRPATPLPFRAVLVTALGVAAYQPLFFAGVATTGVALGTVIAIGSGPVFAGLISVAVGPWRPGRRWIIATALAITGVVAIVGLPHSGEVRGVLFAAGAGLCYAVFATGSKHLLSFLSPVGAMAWGFGVGALLLSPALLLGDTGFVSEPRGAAMVLWLGLAATTVAYVLFGFGLRQVDVPSTATLSLAEPVTATVLGVVLLAERPGLGGWLGVGLVMTALGLLAWPLPAPD